MERCARSTERVKLNQVLGHSIIRISEAMKVFCEATGEKSNVTQKLIKPKPQVYIMTSGFDFNQCCQTGSDYIAQTLLNKGVYQLNTRCKPSHNSYTRLIT